GGGGGRGEGDAAAGGGGAPPAAPVGSGGLSVEGVGAALRASSQRRPVHARSVRHRDPPRREQPQPDGPAAFADLAGRADQRPSTWNDRRSRSRDRRDHLVASGARGP